ncbi:MAG: restriction endonuclease subunit S [Alphaproteobacteria bacterium]|nr:restriction endonuclease subunit S [Alphaproteobacteria bacterium]
MWKTVKLGEICKFEGGSQPPKKEFVYEPADGYVRFLQIRDFKSDKNITYIPTAKKNRLCSETDILIGRYGASVGQILSGLSGAYNVALMKTIPNEELISKGWLQAYLTSPLFQKPLMEVSSRSAQNGFSKDDIYDFDVPLPPLAEQQRIVAKLDAAFDEIDEAIHATKIKIQNYFKLEETNKSSFFSNLSSSLIELEKTSEIINGYAFKSGDFQHSNGVPVIKITNVGIRDFVETNDVNLPKDFLAKHKQFAVKQGDIVFALTRTVINGGLKVAVVPKNYEGALLNQRVASVSANPKLMNSEFLYSYLSSSMVLDYVLSNVNTLMQPNLSITDLKKLPVPNIPIDKQLTYSQTLKETEIQFQNIRTIETKKLSELEKLKSSILAQELQSEAA